MINHQAFYSHRFFERPHFFKSCKWSPDGSCILSNNNNNVLRLYHTPADITDPAPQGSTDFSEAFSYSHPESVYDYCWYPRMNSAQPETCCFISTSGDNPIKLFDAFSSKVRASFLPLNRTEELTHALSVAFNMTGDLVYSGHNKAMRIFDIHYPGPHPLYTLEKKDLGIVSALAVNPDYSGIVAAASYSGTISLFTERFDPICSLRATRGKAITKAKFSPDGHYLFTGLRKNSAIECWDIRNTRHVVYTMDRLCPTNQHIDFDFCFGDDKKLLCSGSHDGDMYFYDLQTNGRFVYKSNFSCDCLNGISVAPFNPNVIATTTGKRSFSRKHPFENVFCLHFLTFL